MLPARAAHADVASAPTVVVMVVVVVEVDGTVAVIIAVYVKK